MAEFDLVVRSGTVVDGTGAAPWRGDVAICSGVIAEVGDVAGSGRREIDADGLVVTPGFVDIHTHYDGQAVWDNQLQPSSWHGVTTAIAGNCGVGFAPVRAEHRDKLIELMEGVEDIPGTALYEGLTWEWSSFSEYLDVLGTRPRDIDLATQVPHSPLRFFAMGERAVAFEQATEDEIEVMASLAGEAILAGALGFSTDRFPGHKTKAGVESPTHGSGADELASIAAAVGRTGTGVLQYVTDFADYTDVTWDFSTMRRMVAASGRPLSVSVVQSRYKPQFYRQVLDQIEAANAAGLPIRAQVAARAIGMLLGLECSLSPFMMNQVWESIAHLPVAEQARRMSDPQLRTAILAAQSNDKNGNIPGGMWIDRYDTMYALTDTPDYEPDVNDSLESIAARSGCTPEELAYDALVADEGKGLIYQPFSNYADGSLDAVREMLVHPHSLPDSVTVAPTSRRSATAAFRRPCCSTGYANARLADWTCRSSSSGSRATPPERSACSTAVSSVRGIKPT